MNRLLIRITSAAAALAMLFVLGGCMFVNFGNGYSAGRVRGEGPMVTRTYAAPDFTVASISGYYELVYSSAPSDEITIEIQENLAEYLEVSVKNDTLWIRSDREFQVNDKNTPKIYISNPNLKSLEVYGAIEINQADKITGDSFSLDVSGACDANLSLEVGQLSAFVSGAGEMELSGTATTTDLQISGAGKIDALELQTEDATVRISGAGTSSISCSNNLSVSISGAGSLEYRGNPKLSQNISGAGTIRNVD